MVLNKRPCHFNQWSFALERWEPFTSENFPNTIPFWINVTGVPVHFWNDKTFTEIANAVGKKLLVDETKARIQVSINADQPLQFERRIGFPNGDIGKVSLSYEGLHRYCFTCNLISHDENTCPQLTPTERDYKKKQRAESQANNDRARLPPQSSQTFNTRNPLKRPRSPAYGRNTSPVAASRSNELFREDKRQRSTPSSHPGRDGHYSDYHNRDHRSSSRQDIGTLQGRAVWSRLEAPSTRETSRGRNNDRHQPRNTPRYKAPWQRPSSPPREWRQRTSKQDPKNKVPENRVPGNRERLPERSRGTFDSQRTVSDNRASLESGEIFANRNHNPETRIAETEEERIRRIKGKAIDTGSPSSLGNPKRPSFSLVQRNTTLTINEQHASSPQRALLAEQRYHLSTQEPNDLSFVPMEGLELGIDTPLTELENAEVDNLVLETERLEMEENMLDIDNMIDVDNDDLLGDSPDHDAEKIEAISQLSPATAAISRDALPPPQQDTAMADATLQQVPVNKTQRKHRDQMLGYAPKGLLKKKVPRSPAKGSTASKKLQAFVLFVHGPSQ
ncbi:BnaAnng04150D [Brassica napus]|uniref:(rape) hypothetical protein n=1 Tax=Brassica napus TaxID=3708 RepID=A0A078GVY9_BRANA|nr:unnamed protein product [Brassica napus]CDY30640.1 BnaAnng04150D [Brassica napus]